MKNKTAAEIAAEEYTKDHAFCKCTDPIYDEYYICVNCLDPHIAMHTSFLAGIEWFINNKLEKYLEMARLNDKGYYFHEIKDILDKARRGE